MNQHMTTIVFGVWEANGQHWHFKNVVSNTHRLCVQRQVYRSRQNSIVRTGSVPRLVSGTSSNCCLPEPSSWEYKSTVSPTVQFGMLR